MRFPVRAGIHANDLHQASSCMLKVFFTLARGVTPAVAPHLIVVWSACNENGGPDILLLVRSPTLLGGQAWTPQQHSARIWRAQPEDKPARATLVSTRARTSASSARSATRRSALRKVRHSIACGPLRRR